MRAWLTFVATFMIGQVLAITVQAAGMPSAAAFMCGVIYMIVAALLLNTRRAGG